MNDTGEPKTCTISVLITDTQGQKQTASFLVVVESVPTDCAYVLTPAQVSVPPAGGDATITVATGALCPWTAASNVPWITVTAGASGTGNGTVSITISSLDAAEGRTGLLTIDGQTVPVAQQGVGYTYYLAEGATVNGFFDTRIALLNPDVATPANVTVEFQLKDSATVLTHTLLVGAHQRATIDVSMLATLNPALAGLASAEFSTVVRSDRPILVDRTMKWDGTGYGRTPSAASTRRRARGTWLKARRSSGFEL